MSLSKTIQSPKGGYLLEGFGETLAAQNSDLYDDYDYWKCENDIMIEEEGGPGEEDLEEENPEEEDSEEEDPEEIESEERKAEDGDKEESCTGSNENS